MLENRIVLLMPTPLRAFPLMPTHDDTLHSFPLTRFELYLQGKLNTTLACTRSRHNTKMDTMHTGVVHKQGDQIVSIFAYWAIVYCDSFF
jgi:hypothetical protein